MHHLVPTTICLIVVIIIKIYNINRELRLKSSRFKSLTRIYVETIIIHRLPVHNILYTWVRVYIFMYIIVRKHEIDQLWPVDKLCARSLLDRKL